MQTLQVKTRDADGKESKKTVQIVRSWGVSSGHQIFLHANGTYGFKDGAPARSEQDLRQVITDPIQLEAALSWWNRVGRKQSEAYYAVLEKRQRQLIGDYGDTGSADDSDKDMVLYVRIPVGAEDSAEFQTPQTWMELGFDRRPGWWGQAAGIKFDDWVYVRQDELEPGAEPETASGQKQLADMTVAFLAENEVLARHNDDALYEQYGPLRITKTTPKFAHAITIVNDPEHDPIVFAGEDEPNPKISLESLMLVSVEPVVGKAGPGAENHDPKSVNPGEF